MRVGKRRRDGVWSSRRRTAGEAGDSELGGVVKSERGWERRWVVREASLSLEQAQERQFGGYENFSVEVAVHKA